MGLQVRALALAALATISQASPLVYARDDSPTNVTYAFTNSNGLNFTQMNTTLPNVTIFATGGTIAGSADDNTATTGYQAGALGIQTLIDAVPEMLDVANVAGVQIANVGSPDVSSPILLEIAHRLNTVVCKDPTMAGAVITHGTDTLEETAFFLDATVNCEKPIVIVGAMRPATAISADGPYNLLQSVTVAASKEARKRGALVVMNDRIASAYYVTKTNSNTMDTFKALEAGFLGAIVSNTPYFFYPPVEPTGKTAIDVTNVTDIPRVDILYSYQDMTNDTLFSAVENGAKGVVIAGTGAGSVSSTYSSAIAELIEEKEFPIVRSTRSPSGEVPFSESGDDGISSGYLNPQKARVLLGLLLAKGKSFADILGAFGKVAV
ncbi:Putative L-asparaginase [Aspergillus calidoustus]|uniref:asparaginase n=1 Tax=Aspergillus calidoustus TaxID=454130 RepID=A0A0U5G372_ASPCI|nr:Putative L-asparaginase [Aspergillus calidoustus]